MPEEMQPIKCAGCGKKATGLYSTTSQHSAYIAGFYSVAEGSPWHRYQENEAEAFLCKACLHTRQREERRSIQP